MSSVTNCENTPVSGHWIKTCGGKMCECSACMTGFDNTCNEIEEDWHYCPNCGIRMNEVHDGIKVD